MFSGYPHFVSSTISRLPVQPPRSSAMEALKHNERPEIPVETLMTSIRRVEDAFKTAYEAGHRAFQLQNKDRDIAALYNESLAGCSDQSFNLVVFPLQSALEVLHNFEGVLEAWAGKAKRMKFVRGLLGM